ncbi:hypothetical protein PIB30_056870 [Stylosanthes scabra]|uniref:Uncharacterized protein n=1 Tax=Stylosanthes scabra TaxID=79078 RepID=A0ABU6UJB9_9FABA|nr:hypothetical protein [Stylosanthes scabra]
MVSRNRNRDFDRKTRGDERETRISTRRGTACGGRTQMGLKQLRSCVAAIYWRWVIGSGYLGGRHALSVSFMPSLNFVVFAAVGSVEITGVMLGLSLLLSLYSLCIFTRIRVG